MVLMKLQGVYQVPKQRYDQKLSKITTLKNYQESHKGHLCDNIMSLQSFTEFNDLPSRKVEVVTTQVKLSY